MKPDSKVLIISTHDIADVLTATPAIIGLREKYPFSYLAFLVNDRCAQVVTNNPRLDDVFIIKTTQYQDELLQGVREVGDVFREIEELVSNLQRIEFDLVINFSIWNTAGIITYLIKPQAFKGFMIDEYWQYSFSDDWWREYLYILLTQPYQLHKTGLSVVDRHLRLANIELTEKRLEIYIGEEEREFARRFFRSHQIKEMDVVIGLNPGSDWYTKKWPKERYAKIGTQLSQKYNAGIIVFGGPGDIRLVDEICKLIGLRSINMADKTTLKELAALIQRCNLFVTNDTGPMQVAAAVNVPIIGIYGPTSSVNRPPYGAKRKILLQAEVECGPCFKRYVKDCKEKTCMYTISVERVLKAAEEILE
ncbi:TPA: hypothetical protein DCX15_02270 [bacterium]|nr:hypothetical protein [bacterium]